jgi:Fe-S oxidoreductase
MSYIEQGLKVVVCEPSCASALNDDLPDLIDDETLATSLRENVLMIDQFLADEMQNGNIDGGLELITGIFCCTDIAIKKLFTVPMP